MKSAAEQLGSLRGSFREGVQQLIDRMRELKFKENAVADVRFFFETSLYDAIITEEFTSFANPKRG